MAGSGSSTKKEDGFTLIEIIAVLILAGILAVMAGSGLLSAVRGYLLARESTALSQKAQLCLDRLTKEYRLCYDCGDGSLREFTNPLGDRVLSLDGTELKINGDTLVDRVDNLELSLSGDLLDLTLELEHRQAGSSLTFSTGIFPRNTYD
ncbi:MAG: type II secretion system protein [Desulfobia sp.]